jgi:hypothetical protein
MLAHQLAAAHRSAMKMSAEMNRRVDYLVHVRGEESERVNIQVTRPAGATTHERTGLRPVHLGDPVELPGRSVNALYEPKPQERAGAQNARVRQDISNQESVECLVTDSGSR